MVPLFSEDMQLPEPDSRPERTSKPWRVAMPQGSRRRGRLLFVAGVILAACVLWFLLRGGEAPTYRAVSPKVQDIASTVESTGTLNPVVTVTVGTPVSGIIKSLHADFNSPVKKGQIIAQIDPATYSALVMQAHGSYVNAQAALRKAQVTAADADRTLARYAKLLHDGSISQGDYDGAATAAKTARNAVDEARGNVEQTCGAWRQAQTNLDYTSIRSPLDGVVISRNVDVGQTVAASFQTPTLFTIAQDLTKMQILASVAEADIGKIRVGGVAAFTVDAYPEKRFSGVVAQMRNSATTVSNVVTYAVVLAVDNKELLLKPGMTANITFTFQSKNDALTVPTAALRFKPRGGDRTPEPAPGQKRVYLLRDGVPVPVVVRMGVVNDTDAEVLAGLGPTDRVVVEQLDGGAEAGLLQNAVRPHF